MSLVFIIFSLFFISALYADDETILSLDSIDELIEETEYNQALMQLNLYMKAHPKEFDKAQKRIDMILAAREQYTELADELLTVIQNEPENDKKKLDIISKLESLEKHPAAEQLAFVREAKAAAEFTYYRSVYNKIMIAAAAQVTTAKYTDACDTSSSGFTLYRDDFYEGTKDSEILDSVNGSMNDVTDSIQSFKDIQSSLSNAVNAFITTVKSGDSAASTTAFENVRSEFGKFAKMRNTVAESGWNLKSIFQKMKENDPDMTESSFLPFAYHFILGKESDSKTGILGSMDTQWNTLLEKMKQSVYNTTLSYSAKQQKAVNSDNLFTVDTGLLTQNSTQMQNFAGIADSVNDLYTLREKEAGVNYENFAPDYTDSMQYLASLNSAALKEFGFVDDYKTESDKVKTFSAASDPVEAARTDNDVYPEELFDSAKKFTEIQKTAQTAASDPVFERTADETNDTVLNWDGLDDLYKMICNVTADAAWEQSVLLWQTVASYYASSSETIEAYHTGQFNQGQLYYDGISETQEQLSAEDTAANLSHGKYPDKTLALVQSDSPFLDSDRKIVSAFYDTLSAGSEYQAAVQTSLDAIQKVLADLDSLRQKFSELGEKANSMILLAGRAKNEADLRYQQSIAAMNKEDFDSARSYLQKSRTKYNESLSYQESDTLRKETDTALQNLGDEIIRTENEVVVRDVRSLKTKAREAYYNGDFEKADKLLVQAKTRWAQTNVEPDDEITNLSALVSTALSMKTGRMIPVTAPLYPEMSQLLSIVHQDYDKGKKLMDEGKKEEASVVLQDAKDKIQKLQLVYPLNQEASLLSLQIDKLIDPDNFEIMFKRKVDAAAKEYKDPEMRQAAYTDLLDLYEINPAYPGLKQLIYNIEIEIGIRQKPVDKTDLLKSVQLAKQASALVSAAGRDETKLRQALEKVDEAIKLNPDNSEAIVLKDKIQIQIGGQAAVVLSAADEAIYQKAIQALQKNNIIEANALVEQLLQNKRNQFSSKILDLQKKIKALL